MNGFAGGRVASAGAFVEKPHGVHLALSPLHPPVADRAARSSGTATDDRRRRRQAVQHHKRVRLATAADAVASCTATVHYF